MKSLYLFFLGILLLTMHSFAQTPQAINYQGLARGNEGNILINQMVGIRLSIVNDSINGSVVYAETHQRTTDGYGLFALQIGQGSVQTGTFSTIAWGAGPGSGCK